MENVQPADRPMVYLTYSIGFWGWYLSGYWASSHSYGMAQNFWWLNHFGFTGIACIVLALVFLLKSETLPVEKIDRAIAVVNTCAVALLFLHSFNQGSYALAAIAFICMGISQAWFLLRWGSLYCSMNAKDVLGILLVGVALVSLGKMIIVRTPDMVAVPFIASLSFVMVWIFHHVDQGAVRKEAPEKPLYNGKAMLSFWQIATAIAVFFIMWSVLNLMLNLKVGHVTIGMASSPVLTLVAQIIDAGFAVVMLWWLFKKQRSIEWVVLWQIVFVLLALALVAMYIFGLAQVVQVFISASAELVYMFVVFLLAHIARHSIYPPETVFGFGFAFVTIVDWITRSIVLFLNIQTLDVVAIPFLLLLIILIIVFLLPARSVSLQHLSVEINKGAFDLGDHSVLSECCKMLAREYGLSPREEEIFEHLCRGRSKPYIAETLYLSENTIKTYTHRIYQKLGVHSRQELIDLMEGQN